MGTPISVQTGTVRVIERFGKFSRVARPGLNWIACYSESAGSPVSLRLEELRVNCTSKTKDDVFINIQVSVQYQIVPEKVYDAVYKLATPRKQIEAYVYDVVRSEVPKVPLDDVFLLKEALQQKIRCQLREHMTQFGYQIIAAPVTNIEPDAGVKAAMNQKQKEFRLAEASTTRAQSDKSDKIYRAEAEAEKIRIEAKAKSDAKWLQGQGLSRQRHAIIEGLQDSVKTFKEGMPDVETSAVMDLVLLTQYFDTLKDIGCSGNSSTMFVPSNPSCVKDIASQMRQGILEGNGAITAPSKKHDDVPAISGIAPNASKH